MEIKETIQKLQKIKRFAYSRFEWFFFSGRKKRWKVKTKNKKKSFTRPIISSSRNTWKDCRNTRGISQENALSLPQRVLLISDSKIKSHSTKRQDSRIRSKRQIYTSSLKLWSLFWRLVNNQNLEPPNKNTYPGKRKVLRSKVLYKLSHSSPNITCLKNDLNVNLEGRVKMHIGTQFCLTWFHSVRTNTLCERLQLIFLQLLVQ